MKVSVRTVEKLVGFILPPIDELRELINMQLGSIEEITDLGEKYKDARIVRVVKCEKHPNADKLSVCLIDDGGAVADIERNDDNLVQVVCGAPNVHADMWAVWLPPKSVVPSTFDDSEPFMLEARQLRGVVSYGMLVAGDELGINNDHEGIIEITESDLPDSNSQIQPGDSFAETFGLDDTIIEIENKMFTHRPDCFGQMGVAREISAIIGGVTDADEGYVDTSYANPDRYWQHKVFSDVNKLDLTVKNEAPEKVFRLMAVAMNDVKVKSSPLWLQCALVALGSKPINNVVDATNYIMLMTAQPTHAYDYDKLRGRTLVARMAQDGEKLHLLNDKDYKLTADDIVMADAEDAIGLGGIMGGLTSEVDENTKNIVLEVATFDMYAVRKSSMRHGVFTDALTRFNKGQSPLQNERVISELMRLMGDFAGARQASNVFDESSKDWAKEDSLTNEMRVGVDFINERLGSSLTLHQIGNLLRRANFASYPPDDDPNSLLITAPFWRTDIDEPEDIVEEVGRLYGFDKLPRELPGRSIKATPKSIAREFKHQLRDKLSRMGANEVLTYSFVHEKTLQNATQDPSRAFRLSNALSPDLQYYRLSVLPSLLDKVHMNIKAGHDEFMLFEIGKGHDKNLELNDENLPNEVQYLDAVYSSKNPNSGAAYFYVRRVIELLMGEFGVQLKFTPADDTDENLATAPFDKNRSANISVELDGQEVVIGAVGELKQQVVKNFKLPQYTAAFTLLFDELQQILSQSHRSYEPLSRFPSIRRDISIKSPDGISFAEISALIDQALSEVTDNIKVESQLMTIYKPELENTKTTTFRLTFTSYEKTLTDKNIEPIISSVQSLAKKSDCEIV